MNARQRLAHSWTLAGSCCSESGGGPRRSVVRREHESLVTTFISHCPFFRFFPPSALGFSTQSEAPRGIGNVTRNGANKAMAKKAPVKAPEEVTAPRSAPKRPFSMVDLSKFFHGSIFRWPCYKRWRHLNRPAVRPGNSQTLFLKRNQKQKSINNTVFSSLIHSERNVIKNDLSWQGVWIFLRQTNLNLKREHPSPLGNKQKREHFCINISHPYKQSATVYALKRPANTLGQGKDKSLRFIELPFNPSEKAQNNPIQWEVSLGLKW